MCAVVGIRPGGVGSGMEFGLTVGGCLLSARFKSSAYRGLLTAGEVAVMARAGCRSGRSGVRDSDSFLHYALDFLSAP